MADSSLWQNSKGEIITCENDKIAYTAECPCGQALYVPAVVFGCDNYYAPYDTTAYIKITNNKITKVYTGKKDDSDFIDRTEAVKEGNFKIFSYVDPFGKIGKLGPLGERSSLIYEDVRHPPKTSSSLDFLTYKDTRLACFYEYEETEWIVPASWYYYSFSANYDVSYTSKGVDGEWGSSSEREYAYTITPYTEDINNGPDNQYTQLAFKIVTYDSISNSKGLFCQDDQGNRIEALPVDSSIILGIGSLPYGAHLISASSYEGCDRYKSPISISDIKKTTAPITARLTLHTDAILPGQGGGCSSYYPQASDPQEGCNHDYNVTANHDSIWEMAFVNLDKSYNSGLVLYTNDTAHYSFKNIKATASGGAPCWISGYFNCEAKGNGDVYLNFIQLIYVSRSATKVSCTYADDGMLSLFPIKIEESDNDE